MDKVSRYEAEDILKDQRIDSIEIYGEAWIRLKDGREFEFVEDEYDNIQVDIRE